MNLAGQPLVLLAGILGAGKTTFLRTLLPLLTSRGLSARVVINDYHNATVDAATLAHLAGSVTAVSGSCVCCGAREDLFDVLTSSTGPSNEVVLVETNGTTDPLEFLEELADDPRTTAFRPLQVSVVDCERWQTDHWQREMEALQVSTASHVVFTRLSRVSRFRRAEVKAAVRSLNRRGVHTSPERFAGQLQRLVAHRKWFIASSVLGHRRNLIPRRPSAGNGSADPHEHASLAHGFTSVELNLPSGLTELVLRRWLALLPADVLRVKGLARLRGEPGVMCSFQRVGIFPDLARYPAPGTRGISSRAILIGPNLDATRLCRLTEKAPVTTSVAMRRPPRTDRIL